MNLKINIEKRLKFIIAWILSIIVNKFSKSETWLIGERENEAQDNGYHLFKYIRKVDPDRKIFYIIEKNSKDIKNIEKYDQIVYYGTFKHYYYYCRSKKIIGTHYNSAIPDTPFYWKLKKMGKMKKLIIDLQHGITQSNIDSVKFRDSKKYLVCGAEKEYKYVTDIFKYPLKNTGNLGFCRFDNLHDFQEENLIFFMPTWRSWLTKSDNEFIDTFYYKTIKELLTNKKLNMILKKYNYKFLFYPHPMIQKRLGLFEIESSNIIFIDRAKSNLQELMKKSKILITDFSSVHFDWAYMQKKILYFQFDVEEYYTNHYKQGYFKFKTDGFGPVIESVDNIVDILNAYILSSKIEDKYLKRMNEFFPIKDKKNCERNYNAIKNFEG